MIEMLYHRQLDGALGRFMGASCVPGVWTLLVVGPAPTGGAVLVLAKSARRGLFDPGAAALQGATGEAQAEIDKDNQTCGRQP